MEMRGTILWCRNAECRVGLATVGEVPRECPYCDSRAGWSIDAPVPLMPYELTQFDLTFLTIQGILPD